MKFNETNESNQWMIIDNRLTFVVILNEESHHSKVILGNTRMTMTTLIYVC